jgi:hypothetical protein
VERRGRKTAGGCACSQGARGEGQRILATYAVCIHAARPGTGKEPDRPHRAETRQTEPQLAPWPDATTAYPSSPVPILSPERSCPCYNS